MHPLPTKIVASNRFPLKQARDAAALARIAASARYSFRQKSDCLKFYATAGGISNLFATLTRSGSHWSLLGIAIARDLAQGGDGEYYFQGDAWIPRAGAVYTKLDWREPLDDWDAEIDPAILSVVETRRMVREGRPGVLPRPLLFHSHLSYFRLRTMRLPNMKIAVVTRPIYDSMESKFHKHKVLIGMGVTPLESLSSRSHVPASEENDYNFPWEKLVDDAIEFFNSWGDVMRWHRNISLFRYEDLLSDPVGGHKDMTDLWGLNLPRECLEEAFRRITKDEMKKRLPSSDVSSTSRVAFRTKGAAIPAERVAYIRDQLETRMIHDLGYGLNWKAAPSVAS